MRHDVLFHTPAGQRSGPIATLRRLIDNWRKRRRLNQILELDDHILKDIGLNRHDIVLVLGRSLSTDPVQALERRATTRRKHALSDATRRWLRDPGYAHPRIDDV